jgi:hypothetical protein
MQRGMTMIFLPAAVAIVSWLFTAWVIPLLDLAAQQQSLCEGYWPDAEICLELGSTQRPSSPLRRNAANAGCPQWHINPGWAGRGELSVKLHGIEKVAREWDKLLLEDDDGDSNIANNKPPVVWIRRERGFALSRIEEGTVAGNSEFHTDWAKGHICWTDALLPIYIDMYGVEPSNRFKEFVAAFSLEEFHLALEKRMSGSPSE